MTRDPAPSLIDIADTAAELAELRSTADAILSQIWSPERTRELLDGPGPAFNDGIWKRVAELGWPDVLVAESQGGGGGGLRELCVLAEAAGAAALPLPLPATAAAGWCEQRCAAGLTLILDDVDATLSEGEVTGDWPLVPFGGVADRLLVLARRDEEPVLGVVDTNASGVRLRFEQPLDRQPAAGLSLEAVPLQAIASGPSAVSRHRGAVDRDRLATVAELVGIASAANDAAVEYAKVRMTFGRPIGARQAIKHRLVEQRSVIEIARALVNRAADAYELQHPDADALLSLAVFWAIDSLRRVPEGATQVFGGIAYTWEHDAHVHLRRAATRIASLGSRAEHRAVVARWLQSR
ncbi:acyl-CoA dehydrogenase family protein [Mycobacterium sp.]|uniref:acyl-CoA dehydrogenase family protein n=1 Tax=Mycobacterium sp. TaxID=1785 RepID=UPI0025FCB802|nr:acyl-CoA dehydrogenase family protein [Mycobacterium sp.]